MFMVFLSNLIKKIVDYLSQQFTFLANKKSSAPKKATKMRTDEVTWTDMYQILQAATQMLQPNYKCFVFGLGPLSCTLQRTNVKNWLYFHPQVKRCISIYSVRSNRKSYSEKLKIDPVSITWCCFWNIKQWTKPRNQVMYHCHNTLELNSPVS